MHTYIPVYSFTCQTYIYIHTFIFLGKKKILTTVSIFHIGIILFKAKMLKKQTKSYHNRFIHHSVKLQDSYLSFSLKRYTTENCALMLPILIF